MIRQGQHKCARVCVVMPAYNAEATVAHSIAAVQQQPFDDWELVVVDDGSADRTHRIVSAAAALDPRIRIIAQANAGPSAARNRGVAANRADYIAFLDSDDGWTSEHLAVTVAMLDAQPRLGIAFAPSRIMSETMQDTGRRTRSWPEGARPADILAGNPTATCSSLVVRREVFDEVGGMRTDMVHAEDQEWLFRVAAAGWQIKSTRLATVLYRTSPRGLSSDVARMLAGWRMAIEHARQIAPLLVAAELPRATAMMQLYCARRVLRSGRPGLTVLEHIVAAFRASPRTMLLEVPRRSFASLLLALTSRVASAVASTLPSQRSTDSYG